MAKLLKQSSLLALLLCFVAVSGFADHTRRWRQSTYDEFLKGTAKGVAGRRDGHLELAPKFTLVADADASYLWSLRTDPAGILYAGGGSPAKVFRFDASGKPKTAFESTELLAQCIAFDAKGNLYVGTSPDGKVYKVTTSGERTVFFEPKTKYIWDLAFAADGTLYVATGDKGQVYAVSPDGKGELYYASDEAHIKVLGFDAKGNLLAGTEPNGRVLRITSPQKSTKQKTDSVKAEGFVIYRPPNAKSHRSRLAPTAPSTSPQSAKNRAQERRGRPPSSPPRRVQRRSRTSAYKAAQFPRPSWPILRQFPAAFTGSPSKACPMRSGPRAKKLFTRWA